MVLPPKRAIDHIIRNEHAEIDAKAQCGPIRVYFLAAVQKNGEKLRVIVVLSIEAGLCSPWKEFAIAPKDGGVFIGHAPTQIPVSTANPRHYLKLVGRTDLLA